MRQAVQNEFDPASGTTITNPGAISGTGAVSQIGTGISVLNALNTYTGVTTVTAGTLAVGDPAHPSAALSGGGPITVGAGGTLGGYGSVTGTVTNDGTVAAGNATPGFGSDPVGTFAIGGALLNNNMVNLDPVPNVGNTLVVKGNYTATGTSPTVIVGTLLNSGGPLSNQETDRLLVSGNSSGSTSVRVNGFGPFSATGIPNATDGISLIQVAGTSSPGAFTLGGVTGGSPFQYNLNAYGPGSPNGLADPGQNQTAVGNPGGYTDYRLQTAYVTPAGPLAPLAPSSPSPSPPDARPEVAPQVPAYLSAPTALFNAGFQDLDSLHRRLGEIHDDQILGLDPSGEVFLRTYGTTFNYTSNLDFEKFGFNTRGRKG
jgi:autotransporter-associated beta strand protein